MAGPSEPKTRRPAVAGRFYPDDPEECRSEAQRYLSASASAPNKRWVGAIAPHAGWICSGAVAGEAISTLAMAGPADVVVLFGAVHTPIHTTRGVLDSHPRWSLPSGHSDQAMELHPLLTAAPDTFVVDDRFHQHEHAIEVELPLVQQAFPKAKVLPIEVPAVEEAVSIGRETARRLAKAGVKATYVASTDFTHYGPGYRFTPAGLGLRALEWAKDNDRRLLHLIEQLAAERVIGEVNVRVNACGGGAVAAVLSACREMGATSGVVLRHTNSYETLARVAPQTPESAVGYAAVAIG